MSKRNPNMSFREVKAERFQTTKAHFIKTIFQELKVFSLEREHLMTSNDNKCSIKDQAISRIESHIKKYAEKKHIFVVKS